jgi:hypothetical protein
MSIPITPQDIIAQRDLIGLTPDKFSEWVDYVEGLERELEFSKFHAERERDFSQALTSLFLNISQVHTDYLTGSVNMEAQHLVDKWRSYLIESLEMLDRQVQRGEIELEQVESLKRKLTPVLVRLDIRYLGESAAESGAV